MKFKCPKILKTNILIFSRTQVKKIIQDTLGSSFAYHDEVYYKPLQDFLRTHALQTHRLSRTCKSQGVTFVNGIKEGMTDDKKKRALFLK